MPEEETERAAPPSSRPLIFVVDDEPMLLSLTAILLEQAGYETRTFPDAILALRAFNSAEPRPALIVTDYAMHSMTGIDLIRECRRIVPQQKTILISGTIDESVYAHVTAKPNRFLAKPFGPPEFVGLVQSVLAA